MKTKNSEKAVAKLILANAIEKAIEVQKLSQITTLLLRLYREIWTGWIHRLRTIL